MADAFDSLPDAAGSLPAGQSPHEGDAADLAQLRQELARASDQPVKASKWNNYNTDSPRTTLLAELHARENDPFNALPSGDGNVASPPPAQHADPFAALPDAGGDPFAALPETGQPGWGHVLGSGLLHGAEAVGHRFLAPVADALSTTVHNVVDPNNKDFDPDSAQKWMQDILPTGAGADSSGRIPQPSSAFLTPGEEKAQSGPQQVAGALAGMVAPLGMAALSGGAAAPSLFAGQGYMNAGTGMLDKGVGLDTARMGALPAAVAGYAQVKIPMLGATFARSMGLGALTNPAVSIVDDITTKYVLNQWGDGEGKKFAKDIDPFDPHKLVNTAIVGGITGAFFHAIANGTSAGKLKELKDIDAANSFQQGFTTKLINVLDKLGITNDDRPRYQKHEGMTESQTVEALLKDRTQMATLDKIADLHANNGELPEHEQALWRAISRRVSDLGLDNVTIIQGEGAHPEGYKGEYVRKFDSIHLYEGKGSPQLLAHEALHAITSKAVDQWTALKGKSRDSMSPEEARLMEHVDGLNRLFEMAKDKAGHTPELDAQYREAGHYPEDAYGFKNLHEFMSEVFTNPKFQERLHNTKISALEAKQLRVNSHSGLRNMWYAFTNRLHQFLTGDKGADINRSEPTMLQAALNNAVGLVDAVKVRNDHTTVMKAHNDRMEERRLGAKEASDDTTHATLYAISNLLRQTVTKSEFLTRLGQMDLSPSWSAFVANHGEQLYAKGQHLVDSVGLHNDYEKMTPAMKLVADSTGNVGDFFSRLKESMPAENKGKVIGTEDISLGGTAFFPSQQATWLKAATGKIGGAVMKMFVNHAAEYHALGLKLRAEATKHFVEYQKLSRKDQMDFMRRAADYDSPTRGQAELKKLGLQWPTKDMLVRDGFNEAQATAYEHMTRGLDYLYSLESQLLMKNGQTPFPQEPGYMPHVWNGDFRVQVVKTTHYQGSHPKAGKDDEVYTVAVRGFYTRGGALKFVREMQKYHPDSADPNKVVTYRPGVDQKTGPYTIHGEVEKTQSFAELMGERRRALENFDKDPGTLAHMEDIERKEQRGFTQSLLDRTGAEGYLKDFHKFGETANPVLMFMHARENTRFLNLYDEYAKNVTNAYKNAMFVAEVVRPTLDHMPMEIEGETYFGSTLDNLTNLKRYLEEFTANFTDTPLNHLKWLDDEVRWEPTEFLGLSPKLLGETVRDLKNFMSILYLRANPVFYFSNVVQPMHTLTLLEAFNALHRIDGKKTTSSLLTVAKLMRELPSPSPELSAAVKWAKDNHILDAQLEYAMRQQNVMGDFSSPSAILHTMTGGTINPAVERFGRQMSFMLAYLHFKDVFNDVHLARTAAKQMMEMTMVNYDKSSRPLMFTNYGIAGQSVSAFATYKNAYIGNQYMLMKLAAQNPKNLGAWLPLAYTMGIFGATAGAVGLPFAQDFNALFEQANEIFDANLPSVEKMLFKAGSPDWVTYGLLSAGSKYLPGISEGVNISPSVSAVQMDQGIAGAMLPFVTALTKIALLGAQQGLSYTEQFAPVTGEDIWKVGNTLMPGVTKQAWMKLFTESGVPIMPKGSSLEGGIGLTDTEVFTQYAMGRGSQETAKDKKIEQNVALTSKFESKMIKSAVSVAADNIQGIPSGRDAEWAFRTANKFGVDQNKFNEMVAAEIERRRYPQEMTDRYEKSYAAQRRIEDRQSQGFIQRKTP